MQLKKFTFGPFQENTFILFDESNECVIIDPGCFENYEELDLKAFLDSKNLKPKKLLNTHCHLDHIAGNRFVFDKYGLKPLLHKLDLPILNMQEQSSSLYGLPCDKSPQPDKFIEEGDLIKFGNTELEVIFAPGHSPGHVVFFERKKKLLIGGDVLFYNSIGRTDLPMGNHPTLINSIRSKIFPLGDDVMIFCGHGQETTIGFERINNPFLN